MRERKYYSLAGFIIGVIDSVDENGDDSDYNVLVDGAEEGDTADDFGEDVRTLIIPFAADSEQIDIRAT